MSPIFFNNDLSNIGHCIMGKKKSLNEYICSILSDISANTSFLFCSMKGKLRSYIEIGLFSVLYVPVSLCKFFFIFFNLN